MIVRTRGPASRVSVARLAAAGTIGWLTLHHLGRTYGSTPAERHHAFPGDDLVECPQAAATHGISIAASPDEVWPWVEPEAGRGVVVRDAVPGQRMVLESTSHLPLAWRRGGAATVDYTWSFVLAPEPGGTRLVFRWRARTDPWWLTVAAHALLVPADLLISRHLLGRIRDHAVADHRRVAAGPSSPRSVTGAPVRATPVAV